MDQAPASGSDVLAPVSSSRLNARSKPPQAAKKRKRQDDEDDVSVFEATAPHFTAAKSVTFSPLRLLPRSSVPLAWLDSSQSNRSVPPGFVFSAKIAQFQISSEPSETCVLIARLCPNGGLYVVERIESDSYIAFALWHWVNEERIEKTMTGHLFEDELHQLQDSQKGIEQKDAIEKIKDGPLRLSNPSPKKPGNRRGVMARKSILPARDTPGPEPKATTDSELSPVDFCLKMETQGIVDMAAPEDNIAAVVTGASNPPTQLSPLEAVITSDSTEGPSAETTVPFFPDMLRKQYFETLYLSKTSLAYFAKGPLARARAFAQNPESADPTEQLANFYRDSMLPSKKMELKYKESLSKKIKSLLLEDGMEIVDGKGPGARKRKIPKMPKLGKDGLYSDEEEYVHRWWLEREITSGADISMEARSQEMKSKISDLRTRETEMQMLLLLELMTLGTVTATQANTNMRQPSAVKLEPTDEPAQIVLAHTPRKTKAKRDLTSDLESLIDKLCIWHTVGIDQLFASPEKTRHDETSDPLKVKDKLRDFCTDVIIPFYASRLPERCMMICRRLGGPEVSPTRPKPVMKKASGTTRLPPGASIKACPRAVPKRTLERVLSEDQDMRHASPPILSRSLTTPLLPSHKRESSESSQRPASRGGMYKSVSFNNREIDLVADAKVHEAKRRKLARLAAQKQELNAAIDALKKPNRTKAARGIMEDLERRGTESKSTARQHIHITATPKRPKSKDQWRGETVFSSVSTIDVPAEQSVIPATALRPRVSAEASNVAQSTTNRAVLETVNETPSRGLFASLSAQIPIQPGQGSSQIQRRLDFVQSTPASNRLRPNMDIEQVAATPLRMISSQRPVLLTPLKKADVRIEDVFRDAPVIPEQAGKAMDRVMGGGMESSIYDSLGWNDDFE